MSGLLLIGGGGHCLTVIDSLISKKYSNIGIIDKQEKFGQEVGGIPIIGCDSDLESLRLNYDEAFISMGGIEDLWKRKEKAQILENKAYSFATVIHPTAIVSKSSSIAHGVFIGPLVVVNAQTKIGEFCILNSNCVVEHQCDIGSFTHIAPGAVLCGNVSIGKASFIGTGSVIMQGVSIGDNVIIGIGSVIVNDIPDNVVAYGNPCRIVSERTSNG